MFFQKLQKKLSKVTDKSLISEILKNIYRNSKITKKHFSIKKLKNESFGKEKVALVVSGGPSLRRNNHIKVIKKYRKKIIIICADGSLFYLLENNIIPDLVVTLDPHKTRIIRWFGDKYLKKKAGTDFHERIFGFRAIDLFHCPQKNKIFLANYCAIIKKGVVILEKIR